MKKLDFKEIDVVGEETLLSVSEADKFNFWLYETINKYTSGKILEIGSGIGNISNYFVKHDNDITLSDIRSQYTDQLKQNFVNNEVIEIDVVDRDFDYNFESFQEKFDSVFALNVVEHVRNDTLAINNILKLIKPQGKLIIVVPAFNSLFNSFDENLLHYRRYTISTLERIMISEKTKKINSFYFNALGIPGWYIVGGLLKKGKIPENNLRLFNKMVPVSKIVDVFVKRLFGLSVICVVEKNEM